MKQTYSKKPSGAAVFWAWFLLTATCIVAMVPVVGFISWIVGVSAILIATILAIVIMGEGRIGQGVTILMAAYIVVPFFVLIAPVASSALFMNSMEEVSIPLIEFTSDPRLETLEISEAE